MTAARNALHSLPEGVALLIWWDVTGIQAQIDFQEGLKPNTWLQKLALIIFGLSTFIPALEASGLDHLFPELELSRWAIVAGVGGAASLSIYYPRLRFWYLGILPGALMGIMSLAAVHYYTNNRDSVHHVELVLVAFVASLPGVLLYFYSLKRAVFARSSERA